MSQTPAPTDLASLAEVLDGGDVKACCVAAYEHPVVRWLLGGELHPGGPATTRRALELAEIGPGDRLLDVAAGAGDSALLAAGELGSTVVGVELSEHAVERARADAAIAGLDRRVSFRVGDAEGLPFADAEFDALLCECSLCTFPDKPAAVAEMRRVLRPDGRLALCDVVADHDRLPDGLAGALATVACVGEALDESGYRALLDSAGFEVVACEPRDADAARLAARVRDRLRGARILAGAQLAGLPGGIDGAIELITEAQRAIEQGALGYAIFTARVSVA